MSDTCDIRKHCIHIRSSLLTGAGNRACKIFVTFSSTLKALYDLHGTICLCLIKQQVLKNILSSTRINLIQVLTSSEWQISHTFNCIKCYSQQVFTAVKRISRKLFDTAHIDRGQIIITRDIIFYICMSFIRVLPNYRICSNCCLRLFKVTTEQTTCRNLHLTIGIILHISCVTNTIRIIQILYVCILRIQLLYIFLSWITCLKVSIWCFRPLMVTRVARTSRARRTISMFIVMINIIIIFLISCVIRKKRFRVNTLNPARNHHLQCLQYLILSIGSHLIFFSINIYLFKLTPDVITHIFIMWIVHQCCLAILTVSNDRQIQRCIRLITDLRTTIQQLGIIRRHCQLKRCIIRIDSSVERHSLRIRFKRIRRYL